MDSSYLKKIPFEKIKKVGDKLLIYSNTFRVDWILGAFCNYSCLIVGLALIRLYQMDTL